MDFLLFRRLRLSVSDVKEAMSRTHVPVGASEFTLSSLLKVSVVICPVDQMQVDLYIINFAGWDTQTASPIGLFDRRSSWFRNCSRSYRH